jgi:hypothetical protein
MTGSRVSEAILEAVVDAALEDDELSGGPPYRPVALKHVLAAFKSVQGEPLDLFALVMLLSASNRMAPLATLKRLVLEGLEPNGRLMRTADGCFVLKPRGRHVCGCPS